MIIDATGVGKFKLHESRNGLGWICGGKLCKSSTDQLITPQNTQINRFRHGDKKNLKSLQNKFPLRWPDQIVQIGHKVSHQQETGTVGPKKTNWNAFFTELYTLVMNQPDKSWVNSFIKI